MLSRGQRTKILRYCLKSLYGQCVKRKNLFDEKDAEDLINEIGVHIWICLIRYRTRTYKEALKLAYRTGQNALISIVRAKLTVIKRGAKFKNIHVQPEDIYWLSSHGLYANGVKIVDTVEALVGAAIQCVGMKRARFLLRAMLYEWKREQTPTREQIDIMKAFGTNRPYVMRKTCSKFTKGVNRVLRDTNYNAFDNMLEKKEGRWKVSKDIT